jgi:hypothetical protein
LGILIVIASHIFSCQYLVPDAGSRIAAINVIQVIAIAAERVAEFCLARQLNGGAARNEERPTPTPSLKGGELLFHYVQDIARAGLDRIPHFGLAVMVTWIGRMLGILTIGPGLHPA